MTAQDKRLLREVKHYGVDEKREAEKSEGVAIGLSLLPGGGNFYLGQTTEGVLNLLFWPISVVWGLPQTAIDVNTVNRQATVDYFKFDENGVKELSEYRAKRDSNLVSSK